MTRREEDRVALSFSYDGEREGCEEQPNRDHCQCLRYYNGIDRLWAMATNNAEELAVICYPDYEGLRAKLILPQAVLILSAFEQEKLLRAAAKRNRELLPRHAPEPRGEPESRRIS